MKSFDEQLREVLAMGDGVSLSELARRIEGDDLKKRETRRRWLQKICNGEHQPRPASIARLEAALGLQPGYFQVGKPRPKARRGPTLPRRVAVLEQRLDMLETRQHAILSAVEALRTERSAPAIQARSSKRG